MKGFKPTGYGPSAGFKFPASFGFTGSTGNVTQVRPYVRQAPRAFRDGGYVRESMPDAGHATVQRSRPYTEEDRESGGKSPLRPGFKDGGGNWIKGAIKHPGAFKKKAKAAGMSTQAFASKVTKKGSKASATTKRQGALAKTLGAMHKANGGVINDKGALSDRDRESIRQATPDRTMTPAELDQMLRKALPKKPKTPAAGMKGKFAAADGGRVVRGSSAKPFLESVADTGPLIASLARNAVSGIRHNMWNRQRTVEGKNQSVMEREGEDSAGKITASNYSRGGKMKRMGYAKGGGVSVGEAKKIAERTVGEHVKYPAPKGHKGLGAMCK